MDIRSTLATHQYVSSRPATTPGTQPDQGTTTIGQLAGDFAATLRQGEETALSNMTGAADSHALVEALAQTELAVETAVAVRDKVVEAYQEILRMPV